MKVIIISLLIALAVTACTSTGGSVGPRASRGVLTAEEIETCPARNAYEAIKYLRPQFLQRAMMRGNMTMNTSNLTQIVMINGVRVGDTSYLQTIAADTVEEIQYIKGSDAVTRYGSAASAGVFLVKLKSK